MISALFTAEFIPLSIYEITTKGDIANKAKQSNGCSIALNAQRVLAIHTKLCDTAHLFLRIIRTKPKRANK